MAKAKNADLARLIRGDLRKLLPSGQRSVLAKHPNLTTSALKGVQARVDAMHKPHGVAQGMYKDLKRMAEKSTIAEGMRRDLMKLGVPGEHLGNPYHRPAGSPKGGEFCSAAEAGGGPNGLLKPGESYGVAKHGTKFVGYSEMKKRLKRMGK